MLNFDEEAHALKYGKKGKTVQQTPKGKYTMDGICLSVDVDAIAKHALGCGKEPSYTFEGGANKVGKVSRSTKMPQYQVYYGIMALAGETPLPEDKVETAPDRAAEALREAAIAAAPPKAKKEKVIPSAN
jgi:hypothetical protein